MPDWIVAGLGGLAAASTLLIGATVAWFFTVPRLVTTSIMAFGAGVLISTLAYSLVEEATEDGGIVATLLGFFAGAVIYSVADFLVSRRGAHSRMSQSKRGSGESGGASIAIGALVDGVPESLVLGLSVAAGGTLSIPVLVAIAISNVPEGLSSSVGLKASGHSARFVFGLWGSIAAASAIAALVGPLVLDGAPKEVAAFVQTIAAGGILAMVTNTMIPEAFERERALTGVIVSLGFLTAFVLYQLGG